MLFRRSLLAASLAGGGLAASLPLQSRPAAAAAPAMPVTASFSVLGDLLHQVGGPFLSVTALVGPDQDAHEYEPRPSDLLGLRRARMLVINGFGLEPWAERLAESAGHVPVLVASRDVTPLSGDFPSGQDPHAWQDVGNARRYVAVIAAGLAAADPAHAGAYKEAASRYDARLAALDADVRARWQALPAEKRRILTTHDAFAYYGRAYGVEFIGVEGISTEAEPSARDVAAIIRQIRDGNIRALFLENMSSPRLMNQIAHETGVRIGGTLYADALSPPGGKAPTYIDMIRVNTGTLLAALR